MATKEEKFFQTLQEVFTGAKIEGQGGFVNLMNLKFNYYSKIKTILEEDINQALKPYPSFREELFDKLYSFFSRYFSESGSIYFNSTPFYNHFYEKVYTSNQDVILFWKTQMLYYVKTDRIFRSLHIELSPSLEKPGKLTSPLSEGPGEFIPPLPEGPGEFSSSTDAGSPSLPSFRGAGGVSSPSSRELGEVDLPSLRGVGGVSFPSLRGVGGVKTGGVKTREVYKFYFDASTIENKKANEKRDLIYELKEVQADKTIVFNVYYSEKGKVTKTEDILKELKKKHINLDQDTLERAFRTFEKQSEVDFFINKNAKAFLQEQFKLWSYHYFWEGAKEWTADRVNQLQILKDIAFKIIDFISQFEDELVKIWNKPKFVKNSNYVITLDRLSDGIIEKIYNHKNLEAQIKEWRELDMVDEAFEIEDIFEIRSYEDNHIYNLFSQEELRKQGLITTGYHLPYNPKLVDRAKELRKNMTQAEQKLWNNYLRNFKYKVLRQRPIHHFIVDFYCPTLKLIIEIDGDQHYTEEGKAYDKERRKILEIYGLREIRFRNKEVLYEFEKVCQIIDEISSTSLKSEDIHPILFEGQYTPPIPPLRGEQKGGNLNHEVPAGGNLNQEEYNPFNSFEGEHTPPTPPLRGEFEGGYNLNPGEPAGGTLNPGEPMGGNEPTKIGIIKSGIKKQFLHLPIDTKYFKDLELEILSLFDDLDNALDGWLIKSENYQALNTILPKFKEKVQCIYIDPPFNTGDDFAYVDKFQDSTWLSLMNDRISISKHFLKNSGAIFVHLDHNAEHFGRLLLDIHFKEGFINNLIWSYRTGGASKKTSLPYKHDSILFFAKDLGRFTYNPIYERQYLEKSFIGAKQDEEGRYYTDTLLRDVIEGVIKDISNDKVFNTRPVLNLSNEFYGFKTQKPEGLLYLLQYMTTNSNKEIFLDFFAGSGTSLAVAQKLNKKWIGIEMGEHIDNFYIEEIELNNTEKNKNDLYKKFVVLDYKEDSSKIKAIVKKIGILGRLKQVLMVKGRNEPCGISKDINWQGGGFFKYYELEQYEETLANTVYEDHDLLIVGNKSPYEQYIFMKDEKLLRALEIDYTNNKVKVDLNKLYSPASSLSVENTLLTSLQDTPSTSLGRETTTSNPFESEDTPFNSFEGENTPPIPFEAENTPPIPPFRGEFEGGNLNPGEPKGGTYLTNEPTKVVIDIPETLSNLTGKWIKRIKPTEVEFEDGSVINTQDLDYKLIKPLIWWE